MGFFGVWRSLEVAPLWSQEGLRCVPHLCLPAGQQHLSVPCERQPPEQPSGGLCRHSHRMGRECLHVLGVRLRVGDRGGDDMYFVCMSEWV